MLQLLQARPSHAPARLRAITASSIALVAVFALALPASAARASSAALVGQPAPDFVLRSMVVAGESEAPIKGMGNMRLSEHLGEVVVLNFWATWCGPCRREMPLLDEIYTRYLRAGLVLLSINIDEDRERAVEMARTLGVSYPVLFDQRKEVSRAYQVGTLPVTVLIDRAGRVRYVSEGYKPGYEQRYTEKLRELLNE